MTLTRRDRLILLSPVVVIAALAVTPAFEDGPTICPFANITGMACPGCGMTRAASRLLRGDFVSAVEFHPLVPAVAAVAIAGWGWLLLRRAGLVRPMSNRVLNTIMVVALAALLAVWVLRLVTGTLPPV